MESPVASEDGGSSLPVAALATIIVLLLVLVVALVVILVLCYLKVKKLNKYQPLSSKDHDPLPYPPKIKLDSPPSPPLAYTLATPLLDPTENIARYPFIQHHVPKSDIPVVRRRSDHLHTRSKNVVMKRTTIMESEDSDIPFLLPVQTSPAPPTDTQQPEACIKLQYNEETYVLIVRVTKVMYLPLKEDGTRVDGYVHMFITPDHPPGPQTRSSRRSLPSFEEEMTFYEMPKEELLKATLHLEVLDYQTYSTHTLLCQNELLLKQVHFSSDGTSIVNIPLYPPSVKMECKGVVLLSICYDPDSHKLSLIILRAKDLNEQNIKETDPVAKATIAIKDKVVSRLRTKKKQGSCSPIFNEPLSCQVGTGSLDDITITVSLINDNKQTKMKDLGCVMLGPHAEGEELRHWNDVINTPGKHIADWHDLKCQ